MKSSQSNLILGVVVVVAAAAFGIWKFKSVETPPPAVLLAAETDGGERREDRQVFVPPDDPALMNQVFDFESTLKEIDETVWKGEMLSHRYANVFNDLWDELRHKRTPEKTLGGFPFGTLLIAGESIRTAHESEINVIQTGADPNELTPEDWRLQMRAWAEAGYQLEDSEWRNPIFDPATDDTPARSVIQLTLYVMHPATQARLTIRGDLNVSWSNADDLDARPVPATIDASSLTITSRTGNPMFERIEGKVVMPFTNSIFVDPLMTYDLNSDGLVDYVLGCRNQVYWNRGDGNFELGTLCRYRPEKPYTMTIGDFDGDGHADLMTADVVGMEFFAGDADGQFNTPGRPAWDSVEGLGNPYVIATGDVDKDGDLDAWILQYKVPYRIGQMPTPYYDANDGFPSHLLLNDGHGYFTDATAGSGLENKRFRRAFSASFIDLDEDGDLDFIQVSDFAGMDLVLNDGTGHFTDVTATHVDESHALGMGHTFGDYDLDGQMDFYVIGMISYAARRMDHLGEGVADRPLMQQMRPLSTYGSRMYFARDGKYAETAMSDQVAKTGWSWGAASADFDNDLDVDVVVNNGQLSRESVKDYETQFWRHDIYVADSEPNPVLDVYFNMIQTKLFGEGWSYGGNEYNKFLLNEGGKSFLHAEYQVGLALKEDLRSVVATDLDNDGLVDLLFAGLLPWPDMQSAYYFYRNNWKNAGNWVGFRLREEGAGFSPIGARVNVTLNDGRVLKRALITGDSYRSQSAPVAHFGLGGETSVKEVEIVWINGTRKKIPTPEINRYHDIRGRK
jgi:hypothetical protein